MKFKSQHKVYLVGVLIFSLVFLFSCGSILDSDSDDSGEGTLSVEMTDAPFPADSVKEANIAINKIDIRKVDADSASFKTISEDSMSFKLMELRNGVTETLTNVEIEVGNYDLIRLYISDANITLNDGSTQDLKVPSGAQTGLKIFIEPDIAVEGGLTSELLIDFDVSKSFVRRGNEVNNNGFIFKPVLRAVNQSTAGRISGTVADTNGSNLSDVNVWVENDSVITNTFSDSEGGYALIGIPEGTYTVGAYKTEYDTTIVEDVEVTAGNVTNKSIELK